MKIKDSYNEKSRLLLSYKGEKKNLPTWIFLLSSLPPSCLSHYPLFFVFLKYIAFGKHSFTNLMGRCINIERIISGALKSHFIGFRYEITGGFPRDIRDACLIPWLGRSPPWRREWLSTSVFLSGKSHGQKSWWAIVHMAAKNRVTKNFSATYWKFLHPNNSPVT